MTKAPTQDKPQYDTNLYGRVEDTSMAELYETLITLEIPENLIPYDVISVFLRATFVFAGVPYDAEFFKKMMLQLAEQFPEDEDTPETIGIAEIAKRLGVKHGVAASIVDRGEILSCSWQVTPEALAEYQELVSNVDWREAVEAMSYDHDEWEQTEATQAYLDVITEWRRERCKNWKEKAQRATDYIDGKISWNPVGPEPDPDRHPAAHDKWIESGFPVRNDGK